MEAKKANPKRGQPSYGRHSLSMHVYRSSDASIFFEVANVQDVRMFYSAVGAYAYLLCPVAVLFV